MFIGRDLELATLNRLYASQRFEFAVIYGRRRVGKTALISRFIEGKRAIYFMGVESNARQNLENLSKSIMEVSGVTAALSFASFQDALEHVFQVSQSERIILAIDEYPMWPAPPEAWHPHCSCSSTAIRIRPASC